jgi:hypothetical protein
LSTLFECHKFLQRLGKGLDEVHPFSDTMGVDTVLREARIILSPHSDNVGPKNAARIWGFISKFVMLDRFSAALGAANVYPGSTVLRKCFPNEYLGTAAKVGDSL